MLARPTDRRRPVRSGSHRVDYCDYFATVLTRRWMRLFLHASLAESSMAARYIAAIIMRLLETVVEEVAHSRACGRPMPSRSAIELGWTLHGAISHLAIRKHLYDASQSIAAEQIIGLHSALFLAGSRPWWTGSKRCHARRSDRPAGSSSFDDIAPRMWLRQAAQAGVRPAAALGERSGRRRSKQRTSRLARRDFLSTRRQPAWPRPRAPGSAHRRWRRAAR